jgi:DNA-binding transcriptional MerR regulator
MHLVTTGEFCRIFNITRRTLYNWQGKGKIAAHIAYVSERPHYMWDIQQYCADYGVSWKKVKDVLELKCSPETIS